VRFLFEQRFLACSSRVRSSTRRSSCVQLAQRQLCGIARGHQHAAVQFILHHLGEVAQHAFLGIAEQARLPVEHAQGAERLAVHAVQRLARVETDEGRAEHQRIVGETLVEVGVGHHQQVVQRDRVTAESQRARGLAHVEADARLEPLAVGIDQRHQCDRRAKGGGGDAGKAVEAVFLGGVEHAERVQGLDAFLFCEFLLTEHESSLPLSGQQMNRQHPAGGSGSDESNKRFPGEGF
jgi:hypothetical protein